MKVSPIPAGVLALACLALPACNKHGEHAHQEHHKIVLTSPLAKDVVITQPYVCQIRAQQYTEVKSLDEGYLEQIDVKEGQTVKKDQLMFKVTPILYKTKWEAETAEARLAELELIYTKSLANTKAVSENEVALYEAKLARANARAKQAEAELKFTEVRAPFEGIIDRLGQMRGSLVKKEEVLTTLSDNSVMWVYFNVPESRYLEFKALQARSPYAKTQDISQLKLVDSWIELVLANGTTFKQTPIPDDHTVTIEGKFNNETGNIPFRADFPNPERLLRHGQTGTILIHRKLRNALVIPQRAAYEILDKRYVWVVDKDNVVRQRWITVEYELEDIFVLQKGLEPGDRFVLEGVKQVHQGEKLTEFEVEKPEDALANQKQPAQ